MLLNQQLSKQK